MITLYPILLTLSGLSQREAAEMHGVRLDTLKSWGAGRNPVPPGVIAEIKGLIRRQRRAADELLAMMGGAGAADEIEIGVASDDHEAQSLGWPCASAHRQAIAMAAAMTDRSIRLVPRESTPASAAAADVHETALKRPRHTTY